MEKPKLKLVGEDGNAFAILGRAMKAAKMAGWTEVEWHTVSSDATSGDYDHLLQVITEHFDVD